MPRGNFVRLYSATTAFPKTAKDILEMIAEGQDDEIWFMFGLRRLRDDLLVGIGGFDEISWRNRAGWLWAENTEGRDTGARR